MSFILIYSFILSILWQWMTTIERRTFDDYIKCAKNRRKRQKKKNKKNEERKNFRLTKVLWALHLVLGNLIRCHFSSLTKSRATIFAWIFFCLFPLSAFYPIQFLFINSIWGICVWNRSFCMYGNDKKAFPCMSYIRLNGKSLCVHVYI